MIASLQRSSRELSFKPWKPSRQLILITCLLQWWLMYVVVFHSSIPSVHTLQRPTLLAKIFGCYKISFRKTHKDRGSKAKPTQMNLLVMENLFYDRRFSRVRVHYMPSAGLPKSYMPMQIYDLKGSTRNRHVRSTGRENEVLLDENLVECEYYFTQQFCYRAYIIQRHI